MASRNRSGRRPRKLVTTTAKMDEAYAAPAAKPDKAEPPPEESTPPPADGGAPATKPEATAVPAHEGVVSQTPEVVPPDPEARALGEGDRGWAVVEVAEDRMLATVTALALNGLDLSARELAEAMARSFGFRGTFDGKVLRQIISASRDQGVARGRFDIIRGTAPAAGEPGRVEIVCVPDALEDKRGALSADMAAALKAKSLEEVLQQEVSGILAAPGEVLARVVAPSAGTPGRDVYGEESTPSEAPADICAGDGARLDGDEVVAEIFGWVRWRGDTFEVVPSFWIATDATQGYFVHFRELLRRQQVKPEWLHDTLAAIGVTAGVDEAALTALCDDWPSATAVTAVPVAAALAPVDGVDAHIDFTADPEKRAGKVRPDGSIDYRERNAVIGMAAGGLIGRVVEATPGTPGLDLRGKELTARDGETRQFTAGANVKTQNEGGAVAFYSEIDGALVVSGDCIEVQPIFTVSGDVDYETGNIDLPMNVEIGGSVCSGFSVRSSGSITVGGTLEPGARVQATGDVVVANGVFGAQTKLVCGGNVETKLIQNSTVIAAGDITVGSYIYSGVVEAGGAVVVEEGGGERAGSIVGGEVIVGQRIQAKRIGSAETDRTVVGLGETRRQRASRQQLGAQLGQHQREIAQWAGEMGLGRATPDQVEARRARCKTEEELKRIDALASQLLASQEALKEVQAQIDAADEALRQLLLAGTIRAQTIFADVYVEFGDDVSRVEEPITNAEFYMGEEGVRWRPV